MTQSYPEHDPNDLSEQPEVDTAAAVAEEPDVAGDLDPVDDDADAPDDHDDYGAEDEPDQGEDSDPSEVEGSH